MRSAHVFVNIPLPPPSCQRSFSLTEGVTSLKSWICHFVKENTPSLAAWWLILFPQKPTWQAKWWDPTHCTPHPVYRSGDDVTEQERSSVCRSRTKVFRFHFYYLLTPTTFCLTTPLNREQRWIDPSPSKDWQTGSNMLCLNIKNHSLFKVRWQLHRYMWGVWIQEDAEHLHVSADM